MVGRNGYLGRKKKNEKKKKRTSESQIADLVSLSQFMNSNARCSSASALPSSHVLKQTLLSKTHKADTMIPKDKNRQHVL